MLKITLEAQTERERERRSLPLKINKEIKFYATGLITERVSNKKILCVSSNTTEQERVADRLG